MKGNVIVGQSGGPTAAINSSLAGVYRTAKDRGAGKVYGMLHGDPGDCYKERYIDFIRLYHHRIGCGAFEENACCFSWFMPL